MENRGVRSGIQAPSTPTARRLHQSRIGGQAQRNEARRGEQTEQLIGHVKELSFMSRDTDLNHSINERFAVEILARGSPIGRAIEIRTHILEMSKTVLPKSTAGQACSFTLAILNRLIRFLDYPEPRTGAQHQSRREFNEAYRSWQKKLDHIGSEQAGPHVAAIISAIESCRRLKISVRDYLADILPGLANAPLLRVAELTLTAWADKI